ncbi:MAG: tRNA(Ile)-lysidine synthase [Candidatus Tokpelaia sp. JSC189]|nr:MAG: tRNA(Ile)-lysidine synthase [Candidatus Tokpelaia sp. JSC189]
MMISLSSLFDQNDFAGIDCIIAAVSGGSDSLAMLFLLRDYLVRSGWKQRLVAVTIDHGLRDESASEARDVAELCARNSIVHETLAWREEKPVRAVSERARVARYNLLCEAAEKYGARMIVTGHTLDDQVETYIMRLLRGGNSSRGLAAMPRLSLLWQKFRLLRPFLGIRRITLRNYLLKRGIVWIDDPTNANPHYERVRIRNCLDDKTVLEARKAVAAAARKRREEAEIIAALVLKSHMRLRSERLWFDLQPLGIDEGEAFAALVTLATVIMGGAEHPIVNQKLKLKEFFVAQDNGLHRITMSGAVIEMTGKFLRIWREKRNLASCMLLPGQTVIWDGRYRVSNSGRETVILRAPTQLEVRQIIGELPAYIADAHDLHFPSLETTCMIYGKNDFDLPVLNRYSLKNGDIGLQRIILPFDWLVSEYDLAILKAFLPIFTIKAGKMIKTAGNFHDLGPPNLGNG